MTDTDHAGRIIAFGRAFLLPVVYGQGTIGFRGRCAGPDSKAGKLRPDNLSLARHYPTDGDFIRKLRQSPGMIAVGVANHQGINPAYTFGLEVGQQG